MTINLYSDGKPIGTVNLVNGKLQSKGKVADLLDHARNYGPFTLTDEQLYRTLPHRFAGHIQARVTKDESGLLDPGFMDSLKAQAAPLNSAANKAAANRLRQLAASPIGPEPSGPVPGNVPMRASGGAVTASLPDSPSAEPMTDLIAQAADLKAGKRDALWLPRASLKAHGSRLNEVLNAGVRLNNFDRQGGTLVAKDRETAAIALGARDRGQNLQAIIGQLTGSGLGKPVDGTHMVQQLNPAGSVTRESLVSPQGISDGLNNLAAPGRTVRALPLEDALQRRSAGIPALAAGGGVTTGHLQSPTPGRTDSLSINVPSGAYVMPADIVSGLGEGNTQAGAVTLERLFPSGEGESPGHNPVPILAAGGEYVISPSGVIKAGGGNLKKGHDILDAFVKRQRAKQIKTLKGLPGPER